MVYIVKWRNAPDAEPMEQECNTEAGAEQWAFARIAQDFVDSVWVEDEKGQLLIDDAEIRRRHKAKG